MATLDELQQQLAALSARVDALTTPPDDYYTSKYSGEEIDAGIEKTGSLPESWPLPIASGGTGADTAQLALANLGGRPNRNLARNPDFRINQRNFSSDNWTSGYGPDGWVSTGGGHLEYSGGAVKTVSQYLHQYYDLGKIDAGIYTISAFCTRNIAGYLGFWGGESAKYQSTNYDNGVASATVEITEDMVNPDKKGYLYILCENSGTISWVKLEKSPFQTLAYKDSSGNWHPLDAIDYGEELARCQRYLQVYNELFVGGTTINYGPGYRLYVPLLIPSMRVKPAVTVTVGSKYGTATDNVEVDPKINSLAINISSSNQSQPTAAAAYINIIISAEL